MRTELVIKSKSLVGSSDLTLLAPLKKGLVPALDSITYKTRAKRLMQTLTGGRAAMHEYALFRPLSDSVERVAKIHSFRVMVLEPEDKILLAVTFDGTLDSYIRVLWQKVGSLLDIIFCNAEGYVVACENSYQAWADWVRSVQVETHFFFHTHGLTVEDVQYLRQEEAIHRHVPDAAAVPLEVARHHVVLAEDAAWAAARSNAASQAETIRQSLQSLAVLYQLTDMYLPRSNDGPILKRAARDLLREFVPLVQGAGTDVREAMRKRFARQLDWLVPPDGSAAADMSRVVPSLPDVAEYDPQDVQGGLLRSPADASHGCLVMLAFDTPRAAADLLQVLQRQVTRDGDVPQGEPTINVAITYEGLRAFGLDEARLAWFPQEFREGMAARASMLGDFRTNHPRRWRLPLQNWKPPSTQQPPVAIEMAAVHLLVQLRIQAPHNPIDDPAHTGHPLHAAISRLFDRHPGVHVLSVQAMRRHAIHGQKPNESSLMTEHFGFADGVSNPVFNRAEGGDVYRNQIHLGEVLLGHPNEADLHPDGEPPDERYQWLRNGSFMVLRKLSQNVAALNDAVQRAQEQTRLPHELIRAKMMGRWPDGKSLVEPKDDTKPNDFHFAGDSEGRRCPFHAHIRRSNPREPDVPATASGPQEPLGRRRPRLVRRGMSYGPRYRAPAPGCAEPESNAQERGLFFIAYNASIAEQFELVQRWIAGGNSTGGFSGQSDPFLGVPEIGETRAYRFEEGGQVHTIALDRAPELNAEPQPFVRLEWGMYLFTPSITMLGLLIDSARAADAAARPAPVWSVERGEATIQRLAKLPPSEALDEWKTALEDADARDKFGSASIWAAIREKHGGVLKTPYGVLVADRTRIMEVLSDRQDRFSVGAVSGVAPAPGVKPACSYHQRMTASIGEIYLGLDESGTEAGESRYAEMAGPINRAIGDIKKADAFKAAFDITKELLKAFVKGENDYALVKPIPAQHGVRRWELNLDAREIFDQVLGQLCRLWFGLPNSAHEGLVLGNWRWDWKESDAAIYPTQFTAPSRFIFQPHPATAVKRYGRTYGRALTKGLKTFVRQHRVNNTVPDAPLARAIFAATKDRNLPPDEADDFAARTFAGTLMGMLPTVDGNLKLSLNEWLRDGSFWSLRAAWAEAGGPADLDKATKLLRPTLVDSMQLRPAAELIWRTATGDNDRIGEVEVQRGDVIVLGLVSAAQQCLVDGDPDLSPVFGGHRGGADPFPVHACPGYQAAMGVLLGVLAAFIDEPSSMRPSPAPLAFTLEGPARPPAPPAPIAPPSPAAPSATT